MMLLAAVNWQTCFFALFALTACFFALAVLFSSNIVRMAFYLVVSLGAASGLFFLAGAEFVGAMQLMIYVGGTLVLLVFGVMLTSQSRFTSLKTAGGDWVVASVLGGALLLLLTAAALNVPQWREPRQAGLPIAESKTSARIGLAFTGVRVDKADELNDDLRAGMCGYLLPFVIVSVHLLVVLIGAAYMARAKKRAPPAAREAAV
jgi:NADH:ubiquinone oxidoreductase subunit 6 (subunit J)